MTNPASETAQKHQSLVYPGVDLGEGLNQTKPDPDNRSTSKTCIDVDKDVNNIGEWKLRAFASYTSEDFKRRVKLKNEGDVSAEDVGMDFQQHFEQINSTSEETAHLGVLVHVRTVSQSAHTGTGESIDRPSYCRTDLPGDLETFLSDCGTSFLQYEELGGYVLLSASLDSKNSKVKRDISQKLGVDINEGNVSAKVAFSDLKKAGYTNLRFTISESGGLPAPDSFLGSDDKIDAQGVVDYINMVNQTYQQDLNNGEIDAGSYGRVIHQHYQEYTLGHIKNCVEEPDAASKYSCYLEFRKLARELETDPDDIQNALEVIDWKLSNPTRIDWPSNQEAAMNEYETVYGEVDECLNNAIPAAQTTCQTAYDGGDADEFCTACQFPAGCSPEELRSSIEGLPEAPVRNPGISAASPARITAGSGLDQPFGDAEGDICALSRISGGFFGQSESITVSRDGGVWLLSTSTNYGQERSKRIRAGMRCVPRSAFFNNNATNQGWHIQPYSLQVNGTAADTPVSPTKYASMVTGLTGEMAGRGESVWLNQEHSPYSLTVGSVPGYLKGTALSFGLEDIGGGTKEVTVEAEVDSNAKTTKFLAPVDEAFCFLTHVRGEFDGAGETVAIEDKSGNWHLTVRAACQTKGGFLGLGKTCKEQKEIEARAKCYYYDQTP